MTAYLADGVRLDGTPTEITDTLVALGLSRPSGTIPCATALYSPDRPSGLSVLDSPAVGAEMEAVRAMLSGEMTRWDDGDEIGDAA